MDIWGGGCCCALGLGRRKEKWACVQPGFPAGIAPGAGTKPGLHTGPGQRPGGSQPRTPAPPLPPGPLSFSSGFRDPKDPPEEEKASVLALSPGWDPPSPASSRAAPTPQSAFPTGHRGLCLGQPRTRLPLRISRARLPHVLRRLQVDGVRGSPSLSGPQHRVRASSLQAEPQPGRCVRVGVHHRREADQTLRCRGRLSPGERGGPPSLPVSVSLSGTS